MKPIIECDGYGHYICSLKQSRLSYFDPLYVAKLVIGFGDTPVDAYKNWKRCFIEMGGNFPFDTASEQQ